MKNVTKTNVLFTFMVVSYILLIYIVRLLPSGMLSVNVRMILPELIMLVPAYFYVTVLKPDSLGDISFQNLSIADVLRIVLMTFCIIPAISLISSLSTFVVENHASNAISYTLSNPLWINLIVMAVIPAVCEEYLFRGLIFNGYKKKNPLKAMLMSSLLFGLIHMNVSQFLYATVMGFLFCILNFATGTLMASILAHCFFNGYNVIMASVQSDIVNEAQELSGEALTVTTTDYIITYSSLFIIAVILGFCAYRIFKKICANNRGYANVKRIFCKENRSSCDESQGRFFDWYIAVGIIICLIYIVLYGL